MKVKVESEKVGLKFNIQKTKIMASGPITSWQIDGETMETVSSWAPKSLQMVTAAMKLKDTCSLKEESKKGGLKLNTQKTKIMACDLITSWQIDGEEMETVTDFIFWGLQNHYRW